jgi:hypothetical protein
MSTSRNMRPRPELGVWFEKKRMDASRFALRWTLAGHHSFHLRKPSRDYSVDSNMRTGRWLFLLRIHRKCRCNRTLISDESRLPIPLSYDGRVWAAYESDGVSFGSLASVSDSGRRLRGCYQHLTSRDGITRWVLPRGLIPSSGMVKSTSRLGVVARATCPVARQRPQGPKQSKEEK